ncbi:MAG: DUF1501 domain-containing protein [Planctomycetaceae bacterium]|nr:MAG: DUF1501 domain-containing protein [Planctomycetaceae bacterium]
MPEVEFTASLLGLSRRSLLGAAALTPLGLCLPRLLRAESAPHQPNRELRLARARSCLLVFLEGGPAHQDLWDLKPHAPEQVRGEFRPIESTLAGVPVCEHLPLLARQMRHLALVRSVHHTVVDHNAGSYYALTGKSPVVGGSLIISDQPQNFPPFGSVAARFLSDPSQPLPAHVQIPEIMSNNGHDLPGQRSGFLGPAFDPFVTGDPSAAGYRVPGLALPTDMADARLVARRHLRHALEDSRGSVGASSLPVLGSAMDVHYQRAFDLLSSSNVQQAFDLSSEPMAVRLQYGLPDRIDRSVEARKFGGLPHLGQSMLLARRLIEAGVRLVTVCTGRRFDQAWDTHRQHFPLLKQSLLPYFDRAFSALLADLDDRGLLAETLVVALGEFGRTPKLGQITSGAGADAAGRDHWPHCYTVLFAGGGIRPGQVYGASDAFAAYPKSNPVTPEDIAATIYHALGIDPETLLRDPLDRPIALATGRPILELFA